MTETRPFLTSGRAHDICERAVAAASDMGAPICVAVVDDGGHLLALRRMDGAGAASPDIVTGKARTAATFGMPTKVLDDLCTQRPGFLSARAMTIEGGVPIELGGRVVGGVAVGGLSPDRDAELAAAAAATTAGVGVGASSPDRAGNVELTNPDGSKFGAPQAD